MNIKERLKQLQKENNIVLKEDYNSSQFFKKNEEIENLIVKAFNNDRNFILLCDQNCDKDLIINYFKNFICDIKHTETIQNTNEDLEYSIATKVIMQNPKEKDIINLLKLSINSFKSFMFAINSKNYENIINNLTTIISIELPNLKIQNIENLIGSSEAIIPYISKDNDGLYYIKNIGEINYKNNVLTLNTMTFEEETKDDTEQKNIVLEEKTIEEEKEEKIINEEEIIYNSTEQTTEQPTKRTSNKYKLLKEKIQKRKV